MEITRTAEKINSNNVVDVSVDVHKNILNFFFEIDGWEYSDESRNRAAIIEKKLLAYHGIAKKHGRKTLRIIS